MEYSFAVLQARWTLIKGPVRLFYQDYIANKMYGSIIMHNVIVADQGVGVSGWADEDKAGSSHGVRVYHTASLIASHIYYYPPGTSPSLTLEEIWTCNHLYFFFKFVYHRNFPKF